MRFKKMKREITVLVSAYNEEKHLKNIVVYLNKTLSELFKDYEILIFDDCSTDKTPTIADKLTKLNQKIKVIHNKTNKGLGYNYRNAVKIAKKEYFTWIPGDNDVEHIAIKRIFESIDKADLIIPYISNQKERPFLRKILSESYINLLNFAFNLKLKYYNGSVVCKTELLRNLRMTTNSFAFQSEVLIRLVKKNYNYIQLPFKTIPQEETKIFRLKNLIGVCITIFNLFIELNLKK
jgi:glycosyltransferase involved in cell wall biosynthesis